MADMKISILTEMTSVTDTDAIVAVDDMGGTPITKRISWSNIKATLKTYFDTLYPPILLKNAPEGTMANGRILPSVTSNNLTLALKTFAGTDPSASDPVYVVIGGVVRTITAALSVVCAAGTNWCNAGGAELATKEYDPFAYLGYNATDGVVIAHSRLPYVTRYDGFSTTPTDEAYAAISTITNAAAADPYVVIGRFAATLSAGAGYTWTVPTYTSDNLIQRPIYKSRWLAYAPTVTGFTGAVTATVTYQVGPDNTIAVNVIEISGTSNAAGFTFTLPFVSLRLIHVPLGAYRDNNTYNNNGGTFKLTNGSNICNVLKSGALTDTWTTSNGKSAYGQLFYTK